MVSTVKGDSNSFPINLSEDTKIFLSDRVAVLSIKRLSDGSLRCSDGRYNQILNDKDHQVYYPKPNRSYKLADFDGNHLCNITFRFPKAGSTEHPTIEITSKGSLYNSKVQAYLDRISGENRLISKHGADLLAPVGLPKVICLSNAGGWFGIKSEKPGEVVHYNTSPYVDHHTHILSDQTTSFNQTENQIFYYRGSAYKVSAYVNYSVFPVLLPDEDEPRLFRYGETWKLSENCELQFKTDVNFCEVTPSSLQASEAGPDETAASSVHPIEFNKQYTIGKITFKVEEMIIMPTHFTVKKVEDSETVERLRQFFAENQPLKKEKATV